MRKIDPSFFQTDYSSNRKTGSSNAFDQGIGEMLQELIMVGGVGFWVLFKSIFSRWSLITLGVLGLGLLLTYWITIIRKCGKKG